MKILTIFFGIFVFFMLLGAGALFGFGALLGTTKFAKEVYPTDLIDDNDKFELVIGLERNLGPYYTYHYEFYE